MKKILLLGLVVVMILSIAACTPAAPAADTATEEPAAAAEEPAAAAEEPAAAAEEPAADAGEAAAPADGNPVIAFVPKVIGQAWWDYCRDDGVMAWSEETGIDVIYKGPTEVDAAAQVQIMSDLVAQGVDILCFSPNDPAAVENVCKEARDKGIIVIATEASGMENIDYDIEAFDEKGFGGFMMDILAEQMGEEGMYVQTVGSMTMESQMNWADAALAQQQAEYPNMVLCPDERVADGSDAEGSYEIAKELLKKYPDLKGFQCNGSFGGPGVCRALEELGLGGGAVKVVGTTIPSEVREYLYNDTLEAGALWDPALSAQAMLNLGVMLYNGETVETGSSLGIEGYTDIIVKEKLIEGQGMIAITKENVDQFTF